jgi:hypothetical protein
LSDPVFTSSRAALAFTILGILSGSVALVYSYQWCRYGWGSFYKQLIFSIISGFFLFLGILLYATLFPYRPFLYSTMKLNIPSSSSTGINQPPLLPITPGFDPIPSIPGTQFQSNDPFENKFENLYTYGFGYWLVTTSCIFCLFPSICIAIYTTLKYIYNLIKTNTIERWNMIGINICFFIFWLLSIIGVSSSYWSIHTDIHFGVDRVYIDYDWYELNTLPLNQNVHIASNCALAFCILGILNGIPLMIVMILMAYDSTRTYTISIICCSIVSFCYFMAIILYSTIIPSQLYDRKFEYGYSYYLILSVGLCYSFPFFCYGIYRIYKRLRETTDEERRILPAGILLMISLLFLIISLSIEKWMSGGLHNKDSFGLLSVYYGDKYITYSSFPSIHSKLSTASMSCFICCLTGVVNNLIACICAWLFIFGQHYLCEKQLIIHTTLFSIVSSLLYSCGLILYATLFPSLLYSYTFDSSFILVCCSAILCAIAGIANIILSNVEYLRLPTREPIT